MSKWTGRWRVVWNEREHMNEVQHLVTGETTGAHVVRMRFHADTDLDIR